MQRVGNLILVLFVLAVGPLDFTFTQAQANCSSLFQKVHDWLKIKDRAEIDLSGSIGPIESTKYFFVSTGDLVAPVYEVPGVSAPVRIGDRIVRDNLSYLVAAIQYERGPTVEKLSFVIDPKSAREASTNQPIGQKFHPNETIPWSKRWQVIPNKEQRILPSAKYGSDTRPETTIRRGDQITLRTWDLEKVKEENDSVFHLVLQPNADWVAFGEPYIRVVTIDLGRGLVFTSFERQAAINSIHTPSEGLPQLRVREIKSEN